MKKRIVAFAVMCMLLLGLCGSVMAYAADIIIEDYTYILGDTGSGWSGKYTNPIIKKRSANSRAVNNMEYSSGNGSTVLFRCHSRNGFRWFVATNEVWNYCDRKLFTWNSGYGDPGYDYKMEARRNTKETQETITVTGSWSPDDKNTQ